MALDSVVKRLMVTAINLSISTARKRARIAGVVDLKQALQVRSSEDFRAGMVCGEAYARSALMIRMYMGRDSTKEESEAMVQMLAQRAQDIKDSLFRNE